ILAKLDRFFNALRERNDRQTRAKAMEGYNAHFEADVIELTRALAPESNMLPPDHALAKLQAQLGQSLQHRTRRHALEQQIAQETEALNDASEALLRVEAQLQTLMERGKCSSLDALQQAEQKSDTARRLTALIEQNTKDLAGFTAGATLD